MFMTWNFQYFPISYLLIFCRCKSCNFDWESLWKFYEALICDLAKMMSINANLVMHKISTPTPQLKKQILICQYNYSLLATLAGNIWSYHRAWRLGSKSLGLTMNIFNKFHGYQSKSCLDILHWVKVVYQQPDGPTNFPTLS